MAFCSQRNAMRDGFQRMKAIWVTTEGHGGRQAGTLVTSCIEESNNENW